MRCKYLYSFFYIAFALLILTLHGPYAFGYSLYIENTFIGNVPDVFSKDALLRFLQTEYSIAAPASKLYLRILPEKHFTRSFTLLENAKKALDIHTELGLSPISLSPLIQTEHSDTLFEGDKKIQFSGEAGEGVQYTLLTHKKGTLIRTEKVCSATIKKPKSQIIVTGTRKRNSGSGTGSFVHPLAEASVSSPYGARWGREHKGIDFAADSGTPIVAADSGTVIVSGPVEGYGNLIVLDHKNGFSSYYAHCNALFVSCGEKPDKGETIASVGSTGNSTGPHLHFEIRQNGVPVDPTVYLP